MVRARRELEASAYLAPYPSEVGRRRRELQAVLGRAGSPAEAMLSLGEIEALRTELESATRNLRRAAAPPPEALQAAVEAYLSREYQVVLDLLNEQTFSSTRATSHVHLLRAAGLLLALPGVGWS